MLFALGVGLAAVFNFVRAYRTSSYAEERNQAAYIISGITLTLIGGLLDVLPLLGLPFYPGLVIGIILFCLLTTVAILKYNLLDIRIILRKSIAYILTSAGIAVPVVGLFFLATRILYESPLAPWLYFSIVIILAFSVPALWGLVQRQVDRWFYRDRYDYLKALETFSWHTQSLSALTQVGSKTVKMVAGALRASNVYLLQPLRKGGDFQIVCSANETGDTSGIVFKAQSPLLRWLENSNGLLRRQDIPVIPQLQNVIWGEVERLGEIGAELIAPLKSRSGQVSGLLLVSQKLSGQPYGVEEIQMVNTIINQIAITLENLRLYQEILEARENLEKWLNSMSDCIMIVDTNQAIQFMNHAAETNFGGNGDKKCWQALGKEGKCPDCPVQEATGDSEVRPKNIGNRNIGDMEYEVAIAPLLNPDGGVSIIEVFRDITERKRLEEEIIQAKVKIEALRQSERLKTDLLSMVSHELRTPLAIIKGYTSTFLRSSKEWSKEEKRGFLQDIDHEADYLAKLVGNLLDMSRLESGAMTLEKDWYGISEILEWADKKLEAVTKGHKVRVFIPSDLPNIFGDRIRIGQVLINLCENAAKYSAKGSQITIEAELVSDSVIISVSDEGEGISPQNLDKVFDRFYRVAGNYGSEAGIGLGLSICRGIVEAHYGEIWAESQVGKGSKFSFSLPIEEKESSRLRLR
jgi:signal transduction histidine kinase